MRKLLFTLFLIGGFIAPQPSFCSRERGYSQVFYFNQEAQHLKRISNNPWETSMKWTV